MIESKLTSNPLASILVKRGPDLISPHFIFTTSSAHCASVAFITLTIPLQDLRDSKDGDTSMVQGSCASARHAHKPYLLVETRTRRRRTMRSACSMLMISLYLDFACSWASRRRERQDIGLIDRSIVASKTFAKMMLNAQKKENHFRTIIEKNSQK